MRGTWKGIVRASMLKIGVIDSGEDGIDPDEEKDIFEACQDMLAEWALSGLLIPGVYTARHTFKTESNTLTIGPAKFNPDIVRSKPFEEIYTMLYFQEGDERPWELMNTSLSVLNTERRSYSYYPRYFFYNQTHPVYEIRFEANVYIGDRLVINGRSHFPDFEIDDLVDDILPLGYRKTIIHQLAVLISPDFGNRDNRSGVSAITVREAERGMKILRNRNHVSAEAPIDPALKDHGYLNNAGGDLGYRR